MTEQGTTTVPAGPLRAFAAAMFERVGVPRADAELVADTLVDADLRGVHSHGVVRLDPYIPRLRAGGMRAVTELTVLRELPATVLVDGNNGIGQVISARAMDPPPAPISTRSIAWMFIGMPLPGCSRMRWSSNSRMVWGAPSATSDSLAVVPPMSNATRWRCPVSRP